MWEVGLVFCCGFDFARFGGLDTSQLEGGGEVVWIGVSSSHETLTLSNRLSSET
ncbi:hypothetical protein KC19_VG128600 [Ceratodon purpureus]|uniref:Uncharacterized protein n=1 Tax=Ceratodon purpureus TaxID=3225 RepID=A0A8T0HPS7_CERPU|nr:hypothetical protein KC19_VG128600 [Ceratodon purpureus]